MPVFAIISSVPKPDLRAAIERNHLPGNFYHWSDRVTVVVSPGTAQTLAEALGVKTRLPDGTITDGTTDTIVTQMAPSYWGWTGADFWTWLTAAHQRDGS